MNGVTRLYTPELLGLAVRLADYPFDDTLEWQGAARSPSCGSTLDLGLTLDPQGRIARIGMRVHACAVGQAAAAIFADAAIGQDRAALLVAGDAIQQWLDGQAALPGWPGIVAIAPAHAFPARHGAMLLPWRAAAQALSNCDSHR